MINNHFIPNAIAGRKPGPFAEYFKLNAGDYTLEERAKIYGQYVAEGGFVGLMTFSTPFIIQEHCYSEMVNNPPLSSAGEDALVLLKRQNAREARAKFKIIFDTVINMDNYFSPDNEKRREVAVEQERIRLEMLKNGCYAGPPKTPREPPLPPNPAAIRAELAALAKELAPVLSAENAGPLAARFRDFVGLADKRLKEAEDLCLTMQGPNRRNP